MALTRTDYTPFQKHSIATSATTGSYSIPANSLVLVVVSGIGNIGVSAEDATNHTCVGSALSGSGASAGSGTRLGFTAAGVNWHYGHSVWLFKNDSGSSVSTTFTGAISANNMQQWDIAVHSWTGFDTTTPTAGWVTVSDTDGRGAVTLTLAATPTTSDDVLAFITDVNTTAPTSITPGTDMTQLAFITVNDAGMYASAYRSTPSTSTSVAWTQIGNGGGDEARLSAIIIKAASAGGISGTISASQALNTSAASGAVSVSGASAATQAKNAGASSGAVAISGSGAATQAPNASAASGTVGNGIAGTVASVQAPNIGAATGAVGIAGISGVGQAKNAMAAAGGVVISGTVAVTQSANAASAAGTVGSGGPNVIFKQDWLKKWQTGTTPASLQNGSDPLSASAGSALVALTAGWDNTRQIPTPGDDAGTFSIPSDGTTSAVLHPNSISQHFSVQANVAGGSHDISVPTIGAGDAGEVAVVIVEITNMPATLVVRDVKVAHNTSSTKTWGISSGSSVKAGDVVLTAGTYENSAGSVSGGLSNPSGYNQIYTNNDATLFIPTQFSWKLAEADGVQSVSFTTTDNAKTEDFAIILTLVPATGAGATGSVAATQAPNIAAAGGTVSIAGSASSSQAKNLQAASGSVAISGSMAAVQQLNVAAGIGSPIAVGSVAALQLPNSSQVVAASAVTGVAAAIQAPNTFSGSGTVSNPGTVAGQIASTQRANVASVNGGAVIAGTAAASQTINVAHAIGTVQDGDGFIYGNRRVCRVPSMQRVVHVPALRRAAHPTN